MLHIWNPRGGWWGEGDEKFFVDGEKFPSTFGTGSEDYFGYAWCNPKLFHRSFHSQTFNSGENKGHISVNRWQISDNVPFQDSFEGAIEKYFPNDQPTLYACTAYWYLRPGGLDPYRKLLPVKERTKYFVPAKYLKVAGALEGEDLKILFLSAGNVKAQDTFWRFGEKCSGDRLLRWEGMKIGDRLEAELPVKKTGRYEIKLQTTKAVNHGIVQFLLDDGKLGSPVDLYNPSRFELTGALSLGKRRLNCGTHKLGIKITGVNKEAAKRIKEFMGFMLGFGYIKLVSVK